MICVLTNEGKEDEEKDQDLDEETTKMKGVIGFQVWTKF